MIIVRLHGGLGNQLFQYAAAKALAAHNHTELQLDTSTLSNDQLREFELDAFNVNYTVASTNEIQGLYKKSAAYRISQRLTPHTRKRFYKQPFFRYDPFFFRLTEPLYLSGYFQSEKYFLPSQLALREQFTFKEPIAERVQLKAAEMREKESVAIHIRRGDYRNKEANRYHGILPFSYYSNAIDFLRTKLPRASFYLFSDQPEQVSNEFGGISAEMVSQHVTRSHFEDFYLMSQCRHNIIANSSFSWWAAWLNQNSTKIVVAPKQWFNEGPKDTQDLIPNGWLRM